MIVQRNVAQFEWGQHLTTLGLENWMQEDIRKYENILTFYYSQIPVNAKGLRNATPSILSQRISEVCGLMGRPLRSA